MSRRHRYNKRKKGSTPRKAFISYRSLEFKRRQAKRKMHLYPEGTCYVCVNGFTIRRDDPSLRAATELYAPADWSEPVRIWYEHFGKGIKT